MIQCTCSGEEGRSDSATCSGEEGQSDSATCSGEEWQSDSATCSGEEGQSDSATCSGEEGQGVKRAMIQCSETLTERGEGGQVGGRGNQRRPLVNCPAKLCAHAATPCTVCCLCGSSWLSCLSTHRDTSRRPAFTAPVLSPVRGHKPSP